MEVKKLFFKEQVVRICTDSTDMSFCGYPVTVETEVDFNSLTRIETWDETFVGKAQGLIKIKWKPRRIIIERLSEILRSHVD